MSTTQGEAPYWQLLALIRGEQPRPATTPDHQWLVEALRAHD
ncbi:MULTISPECIES: hypothetical protein [unclassified Streptomyces]|nr:MULTISPECIES: hypothetical protein [unclassified Streptomyces]WSF81765.1 hypothetical protein OIE70_00220 [Streptomyces sp. NBC_01744]WSC34132.1 hypothetical protein OHA08_00210 [Streptomyces sp. NBC_01763]WSC41926.1 hypothetical protein OHA08_44770 [Streptomyces sp. NBC_01763]WSC50930.1 hypothetical protein OG808_00210 [Streptomyces sp. NBC_01761]WSC58591.1 hypothetical protein OG808_44105 [Streptomyces sp. NBC_01761]